ncbi:hypothetical protein POVWA2_091200 [Plasmodium ovale wallikeri]|uniref:STP1 protein n=1 Tax=Plasmodium ovale wallikeri TaxID=864142 RepID=A0A1A9AS35_PLAOA|nr:hypothetical protein POVWA2_091200 [Plasmodium ovale wallikeri]
MAGDSDITTLTRYIPVDAFISMIERDVKKLIHEYGHINCGLKHEELCNELDKYIYEKKTLELSFMDEKGKTKWNSEWSRKRNGFFSRLFEKEGFINMCYPKNYKNNPSLYQLKSKHIQFCKERDVRKAAVEANPVFSECVKYNKWINTETTLLTREILKKVSVSSLQTVKKYFSTKAHPEGHYPPDIYRHSKLNCTQYNSPTRSHPKIPVKKVPTDKLQPSVEPKNIPGSQGRDGSSPTDKDSGNAKTKTEENIFLKPKPHTPNYHIPSHSKTQRVDTSTVQDNPVKTEDPGSPVSKDDEKKGATMKSEPPTKGPLTAQAEEPPQAKSSSRPLNDTSPTSAIQIVPVPTATTSPSSTLATVKDTTSSQTTPISPSLTTSASSLNSDSTSTSDPLSPAGATKDQNRASHSTTTSDAILTKHSTKTIPAPSDVVSSLAPPQLPTKGTLPAVTSVQGPATPESSSASTVTITTTVPPTATNSIMSTAQNPISSSNEAPGANMPQKPPLQVASEHKATEPNKGKINEKNRIHIQ